MVNTTTHSPVARNTDPLTSKIAGEHITNSGKRARQMNLVAQLVKRCPGMTSLEYGHLSRTNKDKARHVIARRLPEAEDAGLVKRGFKRTCAVSGKLATTWYPI